MSFKLMKVFDCQDMPDSLCRAFLRLWDNKSNDSSAEWGVADSIYEDDDPSKPVDEWLLANGAGEGERVIIKYWW
jgi:hypothetical protein